MKEYSVVSGMVAEADQRRHPPPVPHSTLLHEGNLARFGALDVITEFSPAGWYPDTFTIGARSAYGMDKLQRAYNVQEVLDTGGVAVMGTYTIRP